MTVEIAIFDTLKALVANRVFPDYAPNGTASPFITFQQAGGQSPYFLERAVPSKQNGRFRINVWSTSRAESASIAILIEAAMVAATTFEAKPEGAPIALADDETNMRGSSQDFSVWSNR